MKKLRSIVKNPILWLWIGSVLSYNINKFYLRFLPMEMTWFRLVTDVLPNFLIVIIAYLTVIFMRSIGLMGTYSKLYDYGLLVFFSVLLSVEESTGFFGMSKVSDHHDSIASFSALLIVLVANEVCTEKK